MPAVQRGPMLGLLVQLLVLCALDATVGLAAPGWLAGLAVGAATTAGLTLGLTHERLRGLGPADCVTLGRATLVGGVAALVADSFAGPPLPAPVRVLVPVLVGLTVVALVLDWLDGQVARRTGTVSRLGARFDMEVDAFLILVLSVYVAPTVGWWVLVIGAARYVRLAAGWLLPWMRPAPPPRYWGKVVAATQGVVLAVAAAEVLPLPVLRVALAVALVLLAESFARETWWLWGHRVAAPSPAMRSREAAGTRVPT